MQTQRFYRVTFLVAIFAVFGGHPIPADAQGHSGRNESPPDGDSSLLEAARCKVFTDPPSGYGYGDNYIKKERKNVSVNRELYESLFYLVARKDKKAIISCRIDPTKYNTLKLMMGVADDAPLGTQMTVHVYQGRNIVYTHKARQGFTLESILDLSKAQVEGKPFNIAVEADCFNEASQDCHLMFLQARLIHAGSTSSPVAGHRTIKSSVVEVVEYPKNNNSTQPPKNNNRIRWQDIIQNVIKTIGL